MHLPSRQYPVLTLNMERESKYTQIPEKGQRLFQQKYQV